MTPAILSHALWPELRPCVVLQEATANAEGRVRLEFRSMPAPLAWRALEMRVPCCHCGDPIAPVRVRKGTSARSPGVGSHLYLAVACDWTTKLGCSRGNAASTCYRAIRADVEAWEQEHPRRTAAEVQEVLF